MTRQVPTLPPRITLAMALIASLTMIPGLLALDSSPATDPAALPFLQGQDCKGPDSPPGSTGGEDVIDFSTLDGGRILTSANPCFVSCPNGGFIDCSWSYAGDPRYCCYKTADRCISYNCNTGAIALSKQCL